MLLVLYPRNEEIINKVKGFESKFYGTKLQDELVLNFETALEYLTYYYSLNKFNSIIDIGCGVGSWLKAANQIIGNSSNKKIIGVDKYYNFESSFDCTQYLMDLNDVDLGLINENKKFDLAVCSEVGEHINPKDSSGLIKTLTNCSDFVIFGSATLRQSGDLHINTRNHEFWVNEFNSLDYVPMDIFRPKFWYTSLVPSIIQNTYLFVKKGKEQNFKNHLIPLFNIIHPKVVNAHDINDFLSQPIQFKNY